MRLRLVALILTAVVLAAPLSVLAANVDSQISDALAAHDYTSVSSLGGQSAEAAGFAVQSLLQAAESDIATNPKQAAAELDAAAKLGPQINDSDAAAIAAELRQTAHAVNHAPREGKDAAAASAASMNSILTLAQLPAIVTVDPGLFADIEVENKDYYKLLYAELAQDPDFHGNFGSFANLHIVNRNVNTPANDSNPSAPTAQNPTPPESSPPEPQQGSVD